MPSSRSQERPRRASWSPTMTALPDREPSD